MYFQFLCSVFSANKAFISPKFFSRQNYAIVKNVNVFRDTFLQLCLSEERLVKINIVEPKNREVESSRSRGFYVKFIWKTFGKRDWDCAWAKLPNKN